MLHTDGIMDERIPMERSPVDFKMQLGTLLMRHREAAGLKRAQVVEALGFSDGKVRYIERGQVGLTEEDLAKLLNLYAVDGVERAALEQLAAETRKRRQRTPWGSAIPDRLKRFFDIEGTAKKIRSYESELFHGLVQHPDYARAVISADSSRSEEVVERLVQARLARANRLAGPDGLELTLAMPECVTQSMPRDIMRGQLRHVVDLTKRSKVRLLVVPSGRPAHIALGSPFSLIDTPTRPIAYAETLAGDAMTFETPDRLEIFEAAWRSIQSVALPHDEGVALFDNAAAHL